MSVLRSVIRYITLNLTALSIGWNFGIETERRDSGKNMLAQPAMRSLGIVARMPVHLDLRNLDVDRRRIDGEANIAGYRVSKLTGYGGEQASTRHRKRDGLEMGKRELDEPLSADGRESRSVKPVMPPSADRIAWEASRRDRGETHRVFGRQRRELRDGLARRSRRKASGRAACSLPIQAYRAAVRALCRWRRPEAVVRCRRGRCRGSERPRLARIRRSVMRAPASGAWRVNTRSSLAGSNRPSASNTRAISDKAARTGPARLSGRAVGSMSLPWRTKSWSFNACRSRLSAALTAGWLSRYARRLWRRSIREKSASNTRMRLRSNAFKFMAFMPDTIIRFHRAAERR